jgi:hypothetical protein
MAKWHKHHWRTRTVTDRLTGYVVPCECSWWRRALYLLTGR